MRTYLTVSIYKLQQRLSFYEDFAQVISTQCVEEYILKV